MSEEFRNELTRLDNEIGSLRRENTIDSRVSFDYEINFSHEDENGVKWWNVKLYVTRKPGFNLNITKVVYVLHPTFTPSEVAINNPNTNFALQIQSWGDFHAMAIVYFANGDIVKLIRYLPIGVSQSIS